jgi:hypothetical protein
MGFALIAQAKCLAFLTYETPARFREAGHRTAKQAGRTPQTSGEHSMDISFEEEIQLIEKKLEETRRQIFSNLTRGSACNWRGTPSVPTRWIT